jgi:hypothetical protein
LSDDPRENPWIDSDLQQTGLNRSEGMSEDERAFFAFLLGIRMPGENVWEVHSQRQLVFCQSFPLRVVTYHAFLAEPAVP